MRVHTFALFLFVVAITAAVWAGEPPQAPVRPGDTQAFVVPAPGEITGEFRAPVPLNGPRLPLFPPETVLHSANTCYTMRSYIMARSEKGSDVTTPVGYITCLPAAKVQMKSAVVITSGK